MKRVHPVSAKVQTGFDVLEMITQGEGLQSGLLFLKFHNLRYNPTPSNVRKTINFLQIK